MPEAVTIAPIGRNSVGNIWSLNSISHISLSVNACAAIILQQSITEPPPAARMKLMPFSFASAAPSCTFLYVGFGIIPGKSTISFPASFK